MPLAPTLSITIKFGLLSFLSGESPVGRAIAFLCQNRKFGPHCDACVPQATQEWDYSRLRTCSGANAGLQGRVMASGRLHCLLGWKDVSLGIELTFLCRKYLYRDATNLSLTQLA